MTYYESSKGIDSLSECRGEGDDGGSSPSMLFTACPTDQPLVPASPHSLPWPWPLCCVNPNSRLGEENPGK